MKNEELERTLDELADVQQILVYVLFKRGQRSNGSEDEQKRLSEAARRLLAIARRVTPRFIEPIREETGKRLIRPTRN